MMTNMTRVRGEARFGVPAFKASVAVAALMVLAQPADAQQVEVAQVQSEKSFDVPPQALSNAINLFGLQAGTQISVNPSLLDGLQTEGVSGAMSVDAALEILLSGTGLSWTKSENGIVIVRAAGDNSTPVLPSIVITGEKIQRSYLETQASVGVATGEDIQTYKLDEAADVYNTMANVRYFHSGGNKGMQIRGVSADGVSEPENAAPTIAVIIDGVAQSSEALRRGSRGTWDMQQIEVLRGPQSTVHGPNAMAGAIVMESNDPTFHWEGAAQGVLGTQDRTDGAAMISGPIGDQVAFRLAAEAREQEKDITQAKGVDNVLNDDKYRSVRGKLLIEPEAIEELTITLMANDVYDQPAVSAVLNPFFDRTFDSGTQSTEELRKNNVNNYSAKVDYDLSDDLTLTSVTSKQDTDMTIETAPGNGYFIRDDNREDDNFEQDLRLVLDGDEKLSGVFGLYYAHKDNSSRSSIELPTFVTNVDAKARNEVQTSAAYANLRYKIGNGFTLIGGARVQKDKVANFIDRDVTGAVNTNGFDITFTKDMDVENSYVAFLPTAGVAYDVTENQTVGLTLSRGYRQGFSQVVEETNTDVREVKPEYVWTTELSWRDQSIDNVSWGANLFYNRYQNQQITISDNNVLNSYNADGSYSFGAELEGRADFGNGLSGYGALGVLKTELGQIDASSCASSSCEGNDFPEAPALTASVGVTYKHQSGFFVSSDANYTGSYYSNSSLTNDEDQNVSSFFLANARAGYAFSGFSLTAYVENMFDKDYITSVNSTGTRASIGDGRTFGIQLNASF